VFFLIGQSKFSQNFLSALLSRNLKIKVFRTVNLPLVFCWCETRPFMLRETCRLRMFENRVLRIICGSKGEEMTGGWGKLCNEELHNFYSLPDVIRAVKSRRMRWMHIGHIQEMGNVYTILDTEPEEKRILGRPSHRLDNYIKMDLD
jgi:hypothetical protein